MQRLDATGALAMWSDDNKMQKPEQYSYWLCDPSTVVSKELSIMLDFLDPKIINSRFTSLPVSGSFTLIAGADQGQGAWHSWIKITTYGGQEIRDHLQEDSRNCDPRSAYLLAQVAKIYCKQIMIKYSLKPFHNQYQKVMTSF